MNHLLDTIALQVVEDDTAQSGWAAAYYRTHRERFLGDLEMVQKLASSEDRILELGSLPPFVTAGLQTMGYDVTGVDIAPDRFSRVIERLQLSVVSCDIEREPLPFADDSFDLVLMNELFEHLRIDLIGTCQEVLRVLRPGGTLLVSTPNLWSLRGIFRFLIQRRAFAACGDPFEEYSKLRTLGHMGHVREYTAREVSSFLRRVGFDIRRVVYRGRSRIMLERLITRIAPWWRHYFTVVASKPV